MALLSDDRLCELLSEASGMMINGKIEVPVITLRALISEVLVNRAEKSAASRRVENVDPYDLPTGSD